MIEHLSSNNLAAFHTRLQAWYAENGRHSLPWRITGNPYAIYISEIMLQQTQVETVLSRYYQPFLQCFPTLQVLADADLQEVLKAWEGLGYYSRAVNMHKAAQLATPALPQTVEGLLALPGIGRNTAHAMAAFAYHLPVAVMEANVKRILHRIFALEKANLELLWQKAGELLNAADPFHYNQAMMDLGATVCTKKAPKCTICPANGICTGKNQPKSYPTPKAAKQTPVRHKQIIVVEDADGRIYAKPRATRFLHGLYEFCEVEADAEIFTLEGVQYDIKETKYKADIIQVYSHFTLEAHIYNLCINRKFFSNHWHEKANLAKLPWSKAEQKILKILTL